MSATENEDYSGGEVPSNLAPNPAFHEDGSLSFGTNRGEVYAPGHPIYAALPSSAAEPTAVSEMTSKEMFGSLTGYDEIAIAKAFGSEVGDLAGNRPTMFLRAEVFVDLRRRYFKAEGATKDADAYKAVLEMTLQECRDYFTADPDEVDPEDPVTEPGKDNAPPS